MKPRVVILSLAFGFLSSCSLLGSPGSLDPSFDSGSSVNGSVSEVVIQGDGKVIIGGSFTTVRGAVRNKIARLNSDGTTDLSFDPGTGANGSIDSVAVQPDGKLLVSGTFTAIIGTNRGGIARLNSDGSLDTTFDPGSGANSYVYQIALQTDGKVLLAGAFSAINETNRNGFARLNADGSLDATFDPGTGANNYVSSIVVQGNGKVLVAGPFTTINGTNRNYVARLNADGSIDGTFNPVAGGNMSIYALAVQGDDKVLIGGHFNFINGTNRNYIARLNADGSLDSTFDPGAGANPDILDIAVQPDGKVLVGGRFTIINGTNRNRIARLNSDGSLDGAFNPGNGADSSVVKVVPLAGGRVLVGGHFTTMDGAERNRITRLSADGSVDASFDPGVAPNDYVDSIAIQTDGRVIVGGPFTRVAGTIRNHIARLNVDGSLDSTFNPGTGANSNVNSVVVHTDGKILFGGLFTVVNGTNRNRIAKLNEDGSMDETFNPGAGANDITYSVAVQSDGKVLVGGRFTTMNTTNRNGIARLNPNGSLDTSFSPGTGANADVLAIALQADGRVLIGGLFSTINGTNRNRIARLNEDGSLDGTFNPPTSASASVAAIAVQPDGKVLVGGIQTIVNGTNLNNIFRLNTNGSLDAQFNPRKANGSVYSIIARADGKVYVGGFFTTINGASCNRIARLNTDGSLDSSFDPGDAANDSIFSIAMQPDGNLLVSGAFTILNGTARWGIARLFGDSASLNIQVVNNQAVLTWTNQLYVLQAAPFPMGTYTNVPEATSPYTNSIFHAQQYFRLKLN